MKIDCISDLHGSYPKLEGGDLLIVAGDCTARDTVEGWQRFGFWMNALPYKHKVWIAGNHDGLIKSKEAAREFVSGAHYLIDEFIEIEGLKIWGAPWTPPFLDWHFMLQPDKIKQKWDLIPDDIDILVTHGPAYGILDTLSHRKIDIQHRLGCPHLREAVMRVQPKLHVFGHIHGGYGTEAHSHESSKVTIHVNAAHMTENYQPVNAPITVIL